MSYQNSHGKQRISILIFIASCFLAILYFIISGLFNFSLFGEFIFLNTIFITILIVLFFIILVRFLYPQRTAVKPKLIAILVSLLEIKNYHSLDPKSLCVICKYSLYEDEIITVCPNCHCYFHKEHLIPLLERNFECPICKFDYNLFINNDMLEN